MSDLAIVRLTTAISRQVHHDYENRVSALTQLLELKKIVDEYKITGSALPGTVTTINGSPNIVGAGTTFTATFKVGDNIQVDVNTNNYYEIKTITDNTNLILTSNYTNASGSGFSYKKNEFFTPANACTFTFNEITRLVDINVPNSTYYLSYNTGLNLILGHVNKLSYALYKTSLPGIPDIFTKNIYINSRTITNSKKGLTYSNDDIFSNVIAQIPYGRDDMININYDFTNKILLSKKTTFNTFDIYITDDSGYVIDMNNFNISLIMKFIRS